MYKLVAFLALVAAASAAPGFLGAPIPYSSPFAYSAPLVAAPVVKAVVPLSASYANTYKLSVKAPLLAAGHVAYSAPIVSAAPVVHATPFVHAASVVHAAPFAYAAAPLIKSYGFIH